MIEDSNTTDPRRPPPTDCGAARNWLLAMRWHDLLFAHWRVSLDLLRPHIPDGLSLDTFDGSAWIGVVPFWMSGIRTRFVPPIPGLSTFAELNVRTYVTRDGKPGVWFFSLDAENPVAVRAARWTFHLPYFDARMSVRTLGDETIYHSERTHRGAAPARFSASYRPTGPVYHAAPGTLDHFLTQRLCLYSHRSGTIYRGDIDHPPWPLQPAEAIIELNTMTEQLGFALPNDAPLLHFSRIIDVVAWRVTRA